MADARSGEILWLFVAISVLMAIGLGTIKLAIEGGVIEPSNETLLSITVMVSILTAAIWVRLSYLESSYYIERFKIKKGKEGKQQVLYLSKPKLDIFQVFIFMFRPMKCIKIQEFTIAQNREVTIQGKLKALGDQMHIGNYYVSNNVELFEYIGEEIKLVLVGNTKQVIERNIRDYTIKNVFKT